MIIDCHCNLFDVVFRTTYWYGIARVYHGP